MKPDKDVLWPIVGQFGRQGRSYAGTRILAPVCSNRRAMQKPRANRTFDSWALVAAVLSPADSHVRHRPLFYKVVTAVLGDDDVSSLYSEFCFLCLTNPGKVWSAAETHEAGVHQVVVLRTLTGEATGVRRDTNSSSHAPRTKVPPVRSS